MPNYADIRAAVQSTGSDSRVEVNQRALIDKILARYASAGAVYRELLQNSNDAEATEAEIQFTVQQDSRIVQQVLYRNNGMPFRPQDWSRLQKIAEGNPDVSKVGAFGVGAYTMFSICEEPLVISGSSSLCFVWKGDALWCKTAPLQGEKPSKWTTFVLPSRDPYPLPDWIDFGEFLCASLTFTASLKHVRVTVNEKEVLSITKTLVQEPRLVQTPKGTTLSSWWSSSAQGGAVTTTPKGTFSLAKQNNEHAIFESIQRITVQMVEKDGRSVHSSMDARYVTGVAKTKVSTELKRRMQRVTKKDPPQQVQLQLFLNASRSESAPRHSAERITQSFSPKAGAGRIFIGFRTSQTTGLAAHVAAPFVPTVEREAMDLQDQTLRLFNLELLEMAGILLRLTLEHNMYTVVDTAWKANAAEREALDKKLRLEAKEKKKKPKEADQRKAESKEKDETTEDTTESTSGGLMGFARFMARGVKKKIVSVVNSVEEMMDDGSDLLNPVDPRPLSTEEEDAIILMQSFCPIQSTPDPLVGTALAQGFSRCLPSQSPPVLTKSGVVRGDQARLPNHGMEAFVGETVVRSVVFKNCEEYHTVIAACRKIILSDLLQTVREKVLEEEDMVTLLKWFVRFKRIDAEAVLSWSHLLKEALRFYPEDINKERSKTNKDGDQTIDRRVIAMRDLLFYIEPDSMLASETLPIPDTVLPAALRTSIGMSTLSDHALRQWFSILPIEIWAQFVSVHPSMTEAKPEDEHLRVEILAILNKHFARRSYEEKIVFGNFCQSVLGDKRCVPFDSDEPTAFAAERPSDLYLYSAELKAFEGVGSFYKVAASLKAVGVTEDFLLALGVRKSVSIDFLFSNLESLKWSSDPKPMIEYLRTATLTREDMRKLSSTQYLPAAKDESRLFAPSELYLPNGKVHACFPFLRMLRWPSENELSERSDNGRFLSKIGMKHLPSLQQVLGYLSTTKLDMKTRISCFDFLCDRLGPQGAYQYEYSRLNLSQKKSYRFLPSTMTHPFDSLEPVTRDELQSPVTCFSEESCGVMGFSCLDPRLGENKKLYGSLFQCAPEPDASLLMHQLAHLVGAAKLLQQNSSAPSGPTNYISGTFSKIFKYLSHRTTELTESSLRRVRQEKFIPCRVDEGIEWFRPDQVFFRSSGSDADKITEELFHVIDFCPFLAAVGVKQEATTRDIFVLMLTDPEKMLDTLGSEKKYRSLLRRIAANPPFSRITAQIRDCPFLLSYKASNGEEKKKDSDSASEVATYRLARAKDIYIIDNSFFGRMFSVDRAPHESDLEDFYVRLGSRYISKSVERRFEVVGKPNDNTETTRTIKERMLERSPLLVSPNVTTRPLVDDAAAVLAEVNLSFYEASNLMAVYSLGGKTRRNRTTCFARSAKGKRNSIFVVDKFDWFDVGYAVGDLILTRCQLEDAFFISSILEAPFEQLRARGFPVDRIIQPEIKVVEEPPKVAPPPASPAPLPQPVSTKHEKPNTASDSLKPATMAPRSPAKTPVESSSSGAGGGTAAAKAPESKVDKPAHHETDKGASKAAEKKLSPPADNGMEDIIMQMFPDAEKDFVKSALGPNPSLDDVRTLADQMAAGGYPKSPSSNSDDMTVSTSASDKPDSPLKKSGGLRKRLGRALGSRRGGNKLPPMGYLPSSNGSGAPKPLSNTPNGVSGGSIAGPPSTGATKHENSHPVNPAADAQSQSGLERMLEQTVKGSNDVHKHGVDSPDRMVTSSIPEGLDRGDTCEVVPGQSLKPFPGSRGDGKTINGIRVFSWKKLSSSENFLRTNEDAVEKFGLVIQRLAEVYAIPLSSVALYHDPVGQTIAFNSNKALHFNLRFFHALHYLPNKSDDPSCYSYWYVTMAHELSHHLVSAHNKQHGFFTESYTAQYLPKFMELLRSLEDSA